MEKDFYTSFGCRGYDEETHNYPIEYATDTEYVEIKREFEALEATQTN